VDSELLNRWQKQFKLAVSHQRIAADERDVEWLMFFEQRYYPSHQFIPLVVRKVTELKARSEMG
jgi:hypothetical protein